MSRIITQNGVSSSSVPAVSCKLYTSLSLLPKLMGNGYTRGSNSVKNVLCLFLKGLMSAVKIMEKSPCSIYSLYILQVLTLQFTPRKNSHQKTWLRACPKKSSESDCMSMQFDSELSLGHAVWSEPLHETYADWRLSEMQIAMPFIFLADPCNPCAYEDRFSSDMAQILKLHHTPLYNTVVGVQSRNHAC